MVAIRGPGWGLAPCLVDLIEECDELAPNRSTISDGSVGDLSHQARTSDHNPDDGWVCAVDVTDDKANGCDADLLARHIVARRDPRVKYVIWNGTIAKSFTDSAGHKAWTPYPYTGTNAHEKHTHVSVHNTAAARNDLTAWWPQTEPAPPAAPVEDDDMRQIVKGDGTGVSKAVAARWYITDGLTARHVNDREEAGVLVFAGLAKWDDGEAFVWPQAVVNDLVKVT